MAICQPLVLIMYHFLSSTSVLPHLLFVNFASHTTLGRGKRLLFLQRPAGNERASSGRSDSSRKLRSRPPCEQSTCFSVISAFGYFVTIREELSVEPHQSSKAAPVQSVQGSLSSVRKTGQHITARHVLTRRQGKSVSPPRGKTDTDRTVRH